MKTEILLSRNHTTLLIISTQFTGFSLIAVLALTLTNTSNPLIPFLLLAFIVSCVAFLISIVAHIGVIDYVGTNELQHANYYIVTSTSMDMLGLFAFTIGIGGLGYLYATWLGYVSTGCAIIAIYAFIKLSVYSSRIDKGMS